MGQFLDFSSKLVVSALVLSIVGGLFNFIISVVTGFIGGVLGAEFVGVIYLAMAAGLMTAAIAIRPGPETLMSLPRVLMLTAVVTLIGMFIPQISLTVTAEPVEHSTVAQLGAFSLLLTEAWLSLGLVEKFMPNMK